MLSIDLHSYCGSNIVVKNPMTVPTYCLREEEKKMLRRNSDGNKRSIFVYYKKEGIQTYAILESLITYDDRNFYFKDFPGQMETTKLLRAITS